METLTGNILFRRTFKQGEIGGRDGAYSSQFATRNAMLKSSGVSRRTPSQVHRSYFIIHNTLANMRVNKFHAYFTLSYKLGTARIYWFCRSACSLLTLLALLMGRVGADFKLIA